MIRALWTLGGLLSVVVNLGAAVSAPTIVSSPPSPQPVGTRITFTASAADSDAGAIRYRYRVRPAGGSYSVIRDYAPATPLVWSPSDAEGSFEVEVSAMNRATGSTAVSSALYTVSPRATGNGPIVTATAHPLVALYSAPACASGASMRVRFKLVTDLAWRSMPSKPCNGLTTMNFYVWGLRANSPYLFTHDLFTSSVVTTGPILTFITGSAGVSLPVVTPIRPLVPPTSLTEGITLFAALGAPAFAVDANANVIWYSTVPSIYVTRPVPGGTFLQVFGFSTDFSHCGFSETDAAGNLVKETNVERLNDQLIARGMNTVTAVHHEVQRLDNGGYLVIAQTERISDAQGPHTDIAGDMVLVLNSDLQIQWAWDAFDHLDVSKKAPLGETCTAGGPFCVLLKDTTANDWMHSNSAQITPDGNILLSVRHQDRIYKIAYANGTGDGHVIWTLGKDGDFTLQSSLSYPWFSHQHDAQFQSANLLSLFDNGNTRVEQFGPGHSRGQVLQIDETNRTVNFVLNADLGNYSPALGSAQLLSNGNYEFGSGVVNSLAAAQADEIAPDESIVSTLTANVLVYRVFRLDSPSTPGVATGPDTLLSPAPGSTLSDVAATFCWTNNGNYAHWLDVGTAAGVGDIYGGQQAARTSCKTVGNIPANGSTIYVKIWSNVNGVWQVVSQSSATYTAPLRAFSPADGTVFTSPTVTFSWAPVAGASSYWLDVGPNPGNGSIFARQLYTASQTVRNIPPTGTPVWARLWAFFGGAWHVQGDHLYRACTGCVSTIATPIPATALAGSTVQFCWTATPGANHYWLDVGTSAGQGNLYGADQGTATCRSVTGIPTTGIVHVQLWTHVGADWVSPMQYQYLAAGSAAQIASPTPGTTLGSPAVTFAWNPVPGATGYWLDVGTTPGSGSIYGAFQGTATSQAVVGIPSGTIWVRLWTYYGGLVVPKDFEYTR